ncbi:MAG: lysoplasmalogenase [Rhodobacter sp.]|nr:lysoplasmalogenase [Rhodobacter sp.]
MTAISFTITLGLLAAFAYLPSAPRPPTAWRSVLKTVPLAAFALAAWLAGASPFLTAALAMSALGDLALSREGRPAFLYGLSSFGLAHLFYVLAFTAASDMALSEAFFQQPLAACALLALALSTELWLAPHTGGLAWPVRGYVLLIAVMGLAALVLPPGLAAARIGAVLFIASDLILALRLFRLHEGHGAEAPAAWAVWVLYIGGQVLILMAFAAP